MTVSGAAILVVCLGAAVSLGGTDPFCTLDTPMLLILGGFALLSAISAANGILTVRTNRRSAAMRNLTLVVAGVLFAGLFLATRHT